MLEYFAMFRDDVLRQRYFREYQIWKALDERRPVFRYVQEPVFGLSRLECELVSYLHGKGLNFVIYPRTDPTSYILMKVSVGGVSQAVKVRVSEDMPSSCAFVTSRTPFADSFKGLLDRFFGSEHFITRNYTATRKTVCYPYIIPVTAAPSLAEEGEPLPELDDCRQFTYFFNFDSKEQLFLHELEKAVRSLAPASDEPLEISVYPRCDRVGSVEIVLNRQEDRQPALIYVSGFMPMTFKIVTENTKLGIPLKEYLDKAFNADNLDITACTFRSRFLSLIYNVRYPLDLLDELDD
ncbi:MAG: hypothetical protein K6G50_05830 [bacterium]|nr:hypothetical protein [bacterium]